VTTPTYSLRSSLVASGVYYAAVHALGALSSVEGASLVLLAFLLYTLADDVLGATYDYTEPVVQAFLTVTLVGGSRRGRGRGRPPATAAPATPRSASKGRAPRRKAA
jgi:hypothetical protein